MYANVSRFVVYLFFSVYVYLVPSLGYGQALPSVQPNAILQSVKSLGGATVVARYAGTGFAANNPVYVKRTIAIGKASLGQIIKQRAFSPWGAAVVVALTAAGFVLDQSTGEVTTVGAGQFSGVTGACHSFFVTVTLDYSSCITRANNSAAYSGVNTFFVCPGHSTCGPAQLNLPDGVIVIADNLGQQTHGQWYSNATHRVNLASGVTQPEDYSSDIQVTNVPDTDIWEAVEPSYSDSQLPDLLTNPETGRPYDISELTDPITDIESDLIAQYDGDGATQPDVDLSIGDTGVDTLTEGNEEELQNNEDLAEAEPLEFPDFCVWASVVCDFFDYVKEDEIPTDPVAYNPIIETTVDPSAQTVSIGSAGVCPAPVTVPILFGNSIDVEYTWFCDLATAMSPLVLALSFFASAMIFVRS